MTNDFLKKSKIKGTSPDIYTCRSSGTRLDPHNLDYVFLSPVDTRTPHTDAAIIIR